MHQAQFVLNEQNVRASSQFFIGMRTPERHGSGVVLRNATNPLVVQSSGIQGTVNITLLLAARASRLGGGRRGGRGNGRASGGSRSDVGLRTGACSMNS